MFSNGCNDADSAFAISFFLANTLIYNWSQIVTGS